MTSSVPPPHPNLTVLPVAVPTSVDSDDAWPLHAMAAIDREQELALFGHDDLASSAHDRLISLQNQQYDTKLRFVALADPADAGHPDRVLGYAGVDLPIMENTHLAAVAVSVGEAHKGQGVGTALATAALDVVRAAGRGTVFTDTFAKQEPPADSPDALAAPTGVGCLSRADASSRLALKLGFDLEQTERYSVLHLPLDADQLAAWRAEAQAKAGDDYRVVQWVGDCPEEWVEDYAMLNQRMSVDVPTAGLDFEEEPWDVERVRTQEQMTRDLGRTSFTTAVLHVPSGRLGAFSILGSPSQKPAVLFQDNTLVLSEHRGRSLGLLVKAANLELVQAERPEARRVHTWNAGENEHMLAINVRMGFAPSGVVGMWQRRDKG